MSQYQIMRWREIPSMVIAREGETTIKVMLASRFQEAIDEAAMRLGDIDADAYTAGWNRDPWVEAEEVPDILATTIATELESELSEEKLEELIKAMGDK
ncbi:MAG: virulence factor [Candidatus Planktophila sp.]|nr:virulence factor [Candidatus Planktophila sp.]